MSTSYLGEIRIFSFQRIPIGWQACDGSLLSIQQWTALYSLLGTTYGGNGQTNFAVPDFRGRAPMHWGQGLGLSPYTIGQVGGTEMVTLNSQQLPKHTHLLMASSQAGTTATPGNTVTLAPDTEGTGPYFTPTVGQTTTPMATSTGQLVGGNLPHDNCAPTLTMSFCIALQGVFPTQG